MLLLLQLAEALASNTTVTALDLSRNNITTEGAKVPHPQHLHRFHFPYSAAGHFLHTSVRMPGPLWSAGRRCCLGSD